MTLNKCQKRASIMAFSKKRRYCLFINRWSIYVFSLYGLFTGSAIAYVVALTFWIWLADLTRLELKLINKLNSKHQKLNKAAIMALLKNDIAPHFKP
ncbi:MAG: hypothetical protein DRQ43_09240 [Gammaproteobacteria bacterium]|nr:MAG: hypothetical protein DRQ43_09240 [Gammaproteobacteria bacterium]